MTAFVIDTERTSFAVSFRPGIPGIGAKVSGVHGQFDAAVDEDGVVDWSEPVHGSFTMHVDDLRMGGRMFTAASRQLLSRAVDEPITGFLRNVEPDRSQSNHFTAALFIRFDGRDVPLRGKGRFDPTDDGFLVAGTSIVDPRSFGVPLPPMLNLVCNVRWRIHLTGVSAGSGPQG